VPKALVAINHVFDGEVSDRYPDRADRGGRAAPDRRVGGAVLRESVNIFPVNQYPSFAVGHRLGNAADAGGDNRAGGSLPQ